MPALPVRTIGLLIASNVFMTFAWHGRLRFKEVPLVRVILTNWGTALFEYALQVPANRIGSGHVNRAQRKSIQEIITLVVFAVFSTLCLREPVTRSMGMGFAFIAPAGFFIFHKW